ncbi:oxidoreductase [Raoultella terrigena]|jgi:aryl-alcohol dehydrogenase-like predicted oxidoreductase|uniref:Oxidoreductase YdbC n=1 Tax=Raoultella terrigena TaxID=577 RepID=A0A485CF17_RAOTE|nr:oxidoreductase [Raoultella terrigena]VUD28856.1 aldo-keto reductase [Raoultella sp. NCTC 9187]HCR58130.1 oxidoreductase [Raoultella sp.]MCE9898280.1 oxidoreductase [Raoultella terrigena]MEB7599636.1 oxidoreductase [Raoultella terrigena]NWK88645.1 oxidoreductase [Raoultella terrigena]
MSNVRLSGTGTLGDRQVYRLGYGAMQLAGPGVFGPPADPENAVRVLQAAVDAGVNHIDTSDFYGPHVTNQLIRRALHPYSDDLCIVTKVSARRDEKGNWLPAMSPAELTQAVEDNLRNLKLDVLEVVNLRSMLSPHGPAEGSLEGPLTTLLELKERGLIRHIGLSNVTATQVADAQKMTPVVCVQNQYNVANRQDDELIDALAAQNIAYVPFFPLGGFTPLQAQELNDIAAELAATPMQVALAWLLQRSANILLIPGTSSLQHLEENLAAATLTLPAAALSTLDNLKV